MNIDVLTTCPLFKEMDDQDIPKILSCLDARERHYPKGNSILSAGTIPAYVGIILEGKVQLVQEDYWGNRSLIDHILPGGIFAEAFACAGHERMPLSVVASTDTTVLFIDYNRIITTCSSNCSFHLTLIKNMLSSIARKNIALTRKMEHMNKRTLHDKILSYLSMQALINDSPHFTIPYSRQEFADYLAVDRTSLSRSLSKMQDEGLLKYQGKKFTLID